MPIRFNTSRTEIGSVGEIKAPNTKHQGNDISSPSQHETAYSATPTNPVESIVATVANARIVHLREKMSSELTLSAPAKSRNARNPSSKVAGKLMLTTTPRTADFRPRLGTPASSTIRSKVPAAAQT